MSQKHSKIQKKCAHVPWASYNTPQIELIQYGRRIGKKVYCGVLVLYERWLHMAVLLLRPLDKIAQ